MQKVVFTEQINQSELSRDNFILFIHYESSITMYLAHDFKDSMYWLIDISKQGISTEGPYKNLDQVFEFTKDSYHIYKCANEKEFLERLHKFRGY